MCIRDSIEGIIAKLDYLKDLGVVGAINVMSCLSMMLNTDGHLGRDMAFTSI